MCVLREIVLEEMLFVFVEEALAVAHRMLHLNRNYAIFVSGEKLQISCSRLILRTCALPGHEVVRYR